MGLVTKSLSLLRGYMAILIAFEVPSLVALLYSGLPLSAVSFWYPKEFAQRPEAVVLHTFTLCVLVASRLGPLLDPTSVTAWWVGALIHAAELYLFGSLAAQGVQVPASRRLEVQVVMGFIVANPFIFMLGSLLARRAYMARGRKVARQGEKAE